MRVTAALTVICLHLINGSLAVCQEQLYFDPFVPVHQQGNTLDLAWAGGLNSVQVNSIDLNNDGQRDLLLFDRSGNKVITLLNTGGEGTGAYMVTRQYDHVHPLNELHDWVLLRDYDGDGKEDIFSYSQAGFSVYRNISEGASLAFEMLTYRVNSNYVTSDGNDVIANLYVSQVDLPGIADVDGDGDLDVLTFSLLGSYMEYHKNLSMETYGHRDSLNFEVRNKCWGYFAENFSDNSVTLNSFCSFNVPNPEFPVGPHGTHVPTADDRAHAGSSVLPLDLDGNGTMDLLLGDISFTNLVALYNGGSVDDALMTAVDEDFPSDDTPVDLAIFPAGFYEDVDNDGLKDLLVSPNTTSLAQNRASLWYYKNQGTNASPDLVHQQNDLFQDRMLDFGEGAYPIFVDEDQDGLMDIVIGDHGRFMPGNQYQSRLALLRNVGSVDGPAFELVTEDFASLAGLGLGQSLYPAFGDVDGDGDQDMIIGDLQGRLHFFRNNTTGGASQLQLMQANMTDAGGNVMDVGQFAAPQLFDLDEDGLLDLVVGERNGNLNHYRNTGTATQPAWTLMSEELGGVSTVEWWNVTGHSTPWLFHTGNGDMEILLGSESGWIYHYTGLESDLGGEWVLADSMFMDLYEGERTALSMHDITGDGHLDMVIGNYRGGVSLWRSEEVITVSDPIARDQYALFQVRPNPATSLLEVVMPQADRGTVFLLRNNLGQVLLRQQASGERTEINLEHLPEGLYHLGMEGVPAASRKVMVLGTR